MVFTIDKIKYYIYRGGRKVFSPSTIYILYFIYAFLHRQHSKPIEERKLP
jgi:hypothetical protein